MRATATPLLSAAGRGDDDFIAFAEALDLAGKTTQAALVRTSLAMRSSLTHAQRSRLGVSPTLDEATWLSLSRERARLAREFATALFGEATAVRLAARPGAAILDRGVYVTLDLSNCPLVNLPHAPQVIAQLLLNNTPLAPEAILGLFEMPGLRAQGVLRRVLRVRRSGPAKPAKGEERGVQNRAPIGDR
ncbi:MAG: hypothetical protein EB060_12010 [Proteobacteria bacterium]|nr:hypothetical protein [Pseudomonadota bacterium]